MLRNGHKMVLIPKASINASMLSIIDVHTRKILKYYFHFQ
jgi:hypothetical protein